MSDVARIAADLTWRVREATGRAEGALPLHEPLLGAAARDLVVDCVDTGWVSSAGKYVDRFEQILAERAGVCGAVAVANGTVALEMALRCAGVSAGDEVLTPALTFVGTTAAIRHAGATPHFVDSEAARCGVCPVALGEHLDRIGEMRKSDVGRALYNRETGRPIRALVVVHVLGVAADMPALAALADAYGLTLIEDASESLGSTHGNRPCGSWGKAAALSFNGNKIATTGGGGAILSDDPELVRRAKHLTTTAKKPHAWAYEHDALGWNFRLPNLNAALGCAQVDRLDAMMAAKQALFLAYQDVFEGCDYGRLWRPEGEENWNCWLMAFELDAAYVPVLESLLDSLNAGGVLARPFWKLSSRLDPYVGCPSAPTPVADCLVSRVVCLPSGAQLGPKPAG